MNSRVRPGQLHQQADEVLASPRPGTRLIPPVGAFGSWPPMLRLMRAENGVFAALLVLSGFRASVASHSNVAGLSLGVAAAVAAVTVWFANVVNDIFDQDLDAVGKPWRPLPSKRVSRARAWGFAGLLGASAVALNAALPWQLALFGGALLLVAGAYSPYLKHIPLVGHLSVAAATSCCVLFGAALAADLTLNAMVLASYIFAGTLLIELGKGAADSWHDRLRMRSVATTVSHRLMSLILLSLEFTTLGLGLAVALTIRDAEVVSSLIVVVLTSLPVLPLLMYHARSPRDEDFGHLEAALDACKYFWAPLIVSLLLIN
jgi:4-hydroxybenzoate polyprenyltransferase